MTETTRRPGNGEVNGSEATPKCPMSLATAKKLLAYCERWELRDNTFGDREVGWCLDGTEIAVGYFGERAYITFKDSAHTTFENDEAWELVIIGKIDQLDFN